MLTLLPAPPILPPPGTEPETYHLLHSPTLQRTIALIWNGAEWREPSPARQLRIAHYAPRDPELASFSYLCPIHLQPAM